MGRGAWVDRLRLATLVAREGTRLTLALLSPARIFGGGLGADRVLIAPQDLRTADPTVADDFYAGLFVFSGQIVECNGRSPFDMPPPSGEWSRVLHSLGWLRHLRAAGTPLARANAQALVGDWLARRGRLPAEAQEPEVVARRLLALLSQSAFLLEGATAEFYRRYVQEILRHVRLLNRLRPLVPDGLPRLRILVAILTAAIAMSREGAPIRSAMDRLAAELDRQILADGGHVSRNPAALIEILVDLLPARQALTQRGAAFEGRIVAAIDRMMPMLRFFRHADGSFAAFNGMGATAADLISTIAAFDDARGQPVANAVHSGYLRLEVKGAMALVDTGKVPPYWASRDAHAGGGAFEFSAGGQVIVINCGSPLPSRREWKRVVRTSAAHSTAILADASSCRFNKPGRFDRLVGPVILSGPRHVEARRLDAAGAVAATVAHDGYAHRFGYVHGRDLTLAEDASRLDGLDRFIAGRHPDAVAFAIRFHLHPSIRAALVREHAAVLLVGADGETWEFVAEGSEIELEESVHLADARGVRRTSQIVLSGRLPETREVRWAFIRVPPQRRARARGAEEPALPLD